MHKRPLIVAASLLLLTGLTGCSARRIPGTDIEDNDDTRAILAVMERYRSAVEAEDANGVAGLVAPDFREDGGSNDPEDDFDAKSLAPKLAEQFERVDNVRLSLDIKKITLDEEENTALVTYYWNLRYELPGLTTKPHVDSELKQTALKKVDKGWLIASGI